MLVIVIFNRLDLVLHQEAGAIAFMIAVTIPTILHRRKRAKLFRWLDLTEHGIVFSYWPIAALQS